MTTAVSDTTAHTKLDTINSTLTDGNLTVVDSATRTKLDTVNSKLDTVNANLGTLEDDVETTNTTLTTTNTKLDTVNTNLGTVNTNLGTIETDIETIHTKLDTLETTLTNIETNTLKTLRQYREEGNCFSVTTSWQATTTGYVALYLNNASGSGKNYFIYNIEFSFKDDNHDTARDDLFVMADDALTSNYGTTIDYVNLNSLTSVSGTNKTGKGATPINVNEVLITRTHAFIKSFGYNSDYQEEFIRVPPGKQIYILNNTNYGDGYYTATLRWVEEDA